MNTTDYLSILPSVGSKLNFGGVDSFEKIVGDMKSKIITIYNRVSVNSNYGRERGDRDEGNLFIFDTRSPVTIQKIRPDNYMIRIKTTGKKNYCHNR